MEVLSPDAEDGAPQRGSLVVASAHLHITRTTPLPINENPDDSREISAKSSNPEIRRCSTDPETSVVTPAGAETGDREEKTLIAKRRMGKLELGKT